MSEPAPLLPALLSRRSVRPKRLGLPAPAAADLQTIISAGLRGADHGQMRPWRLMQVTDRDALAEAFVAAERELRPDGGAEMEARARSRARKGPCLLVLVARIDESQPEIPVHEQWTAVGNALSQMLLAAQALGFAGGILSGAKTRNTALRRALHIGGRERIVGFLTFGTAAAAPPAAAAADPSEFLSEWLPSKP